MSHIWISHLTRVPVAAVSKTQSLADMWISRVSHTNESCLTCDVSHAWVMSHTRMGVMSHMHESCLTHEWVMIHMQMSHVAHVPVAAVSKTQLLADRDKRLVAVTIWPHACYTGLCCWLVTFVGHTGLFCWLVTFVGHTGLFCGRYRALIAGDIGSGIGGTGLFGGRYRMASLEDGGKRLVAVTICVLYRALVKEI